MNIGLVTAYWFDPNKLVIIVLVIYTYNTMDSKRLVSNINIRLNLEDMKVLKEEARKLRVPVSTYCRTKLTQDINYEASNKIS